MIRTVFESTRKAQPRGQVTRFDLLYQNDELGPVMQCEHNVT